MPLSRPRDHAADSALRCRFAYGSIDLEASACFDIADVVRRVGRVAYGVKGNVVRNFDAGVGDSRQPPSCGWQCWCGGLDVRGSDVEGDALVEGHREVQARRRNRRVNSL